MQAVMTMRPEIKQQLADSVRTFRLPRYTEIPNVGLYLEQATKYVCEYLAPLGEFSLTPSMISNYVKKGLIDNPVKKQYNREQIAYLIFIALFSVVGLSAEYAIGRRSRTGTLGSYRKAWESRDPKLGKAGGLLGWLPLAGSMCIAIGYAVMYVHYKCEVAELNELLKGANQT